MLEIFIGSIFLSNILFTKSLGVRIDKDNLYISKLTSIILFITTILCYLINICLTKFNIEFLKIISFILIIYLVSVIVIKIYKSITKDDNDILKMIVTNTILLGNALIIGVSNYSIFQALVYSLSSSIGYFLIMTLIYYLNKELSKRKSLKSFRGYPIMLITLSIIYIILKRL